MTTENNNSRPAPSDATPQAERDAVQHEPATRPGRAAARRQLLKFGMLSVPMVMTVASRPVWAQDEPDMNPMSPFGSPWYRGPWNQQGDVLADGYESQTAPDWVEDPQAYNPANDPRSILKYRDQADRDAMVLSLETRRDALIDLRDDPNTSVSDKDTYTAQVDEIDDLIVFVQSRPFGNSADNTGPNGSNFLSR